MESPEDKTGTLLGVFFFFLKCSKLVLDLKNKINKTKKKTKKECEKQREREGVSSRKKEEKRKGQAVSKVRPILLINESLVRRAAAKS